MNVAPTDTTGAGRLQTVNAECSYTPSVVPGLVALSDIAAIFAAFYAIQLFTGSYSDEPGKAQFLLFFMASGFVLTAYHADLYKIRSIMRPMARSNDILMAVVTVTLFFLAIVVSLDLGKAYRLSSTLLFVPGCAGAISISRALGARMLRWLSARRILGSTVVVFGSGEQCRRFLRRLGDTNPFFVNLAGVFLSDPRTSHEDNMLGIEGVPVLGHIAELLDYARARKIDDVVIAMAWGTPDAVIGAVETLKDLPVNIYLSTDLVGFDLTFAPASGDFQHLPVFEIVRKPISGWGLILKFAEDRILALVLLVALAPLLGLVAIAIRLDSPGPVFFMQKRLGFNNKEFAIYKFRSMRHAETTQDDVPQARRRDARVTRVGRFIRATSLDELPQLLNVLNGTMSLVGPRPHALPHNLEYGRQIRGYFARHRVKPGITGWAQVNGLRGETDTVEKMERRIRYDVEYTQNWSLLFDFKIIFMTVLVVLFQKNAY